MANTQHILKAIADLESQEISNVKATTKKHNIKRKTLENHQKSRLTSIEESISIYYQYLTNSQERALIQLINKLTNYRMSLTTIIIKNLIKEIREYTIEKNQIVSFVYRYKNKLKSLYLKSINNKYIKSKFIFIYKLFYKLVKFFFYITLLIILS